MADAFTLVLADVLAHDPPVSARLLAVHVDDGTGHCAGCSSVLRPVWPCTIRWHVEQAMQVGRRRG